jgi:hypothetical protein
MFVGAAMGVVAIPRVEESSAPSGVLIRGVYQALLDRERGLNERDDQRDRRGFRRDRRLAELFEAGESVVCRRSCVESAVWECDRDQPRRWVRLSFDRNVRFVQVTPDDRIIPIVDSDGAGAA